MNFLRILKYGLLNFWRNPWLSLATTLIFSIALLILSIFFFLTISTQVVIKAIEEKMDLTVYFKDEAKEEQILELKSILEQFPQVRSARYISKEEAYVIWQKIPASERIKQLVTPEKNPLPRSLQVKVTKPEDLEYISNFLSSKKWQGIIREAGISYQQNKLIVQRLNSIVKFIKKVGTVISLLFLIISFLVMLNTIRLTIFARKEEIEIQRLVGATDVFIEGPFLIEGILYGLLATAISTLISYFLINLISPMIKTYLGEVSFNLKQFFLSNLGLIVLAQFFTGTILGGLCSLLSVRRYLKI